MMNKLKKQSVKSKFILESRRSRNFYKILSKTEFVEALQSS